MTHRARRHQVHPRPRAFTVPEEVPGNLIDLVAATAPQAFATRSASVRTVPLVSPIRARMLHLTTESVLIAAVADALGRK